MSESLEIKSAGRPQQAVILAGGQGTRMRPWSDIRPKPMIEIHGRPFLEYQIEQLRAEGFGEVLLLLGHLPEVVQDYFGDGSRWGMRISYSVTAPENLTGRRLQLAEPLLDECFLLLYCDNYWPMRFHRLWKQFSDMKVPAMLTVYANRDGWTKNSIHVGPDGYITTFDKRGGSPELQGVEISYALLHKSVIARLPAEGNLPLEESVYPRLASERKLAAHVTEHRYYSIGGFQRLPATETFLARRPAIFLDRDGVLNRKPARACYVRTWEEFEWLPGAKTALRRLREAGFRVIVVSNQAGVARGAMTEADLLDVHRRMTREAAEAGGRIDAVYYCPHNWEEGCECRKPKPGLLFQAQRDFNLDLTRTCFVGDDERDAAAAEAAGAPSALVSEQRPLNAVLDSLLGERTHLPSTTV